MDLVLLVLAVAAVWVVIKHYEFLIRARNFLFWATVYSLIFGMALAAAYFVSSAVLGFVFELLDPLSVILKYIALAIYYIDYYLFDIPFYVDGSSTWNVFDSIENSADIWAPFLLAAFWGYVWVGGSWGLLSSEDPIIEF